MGSILIVEDELVTQRLIAATRKHDRLIHPMTASPTWPQGGDLPHEAETRARMSARCRSSVTVTPGQNSRVPV